MTALVEFMLAAVDVVKAEVGQLRKDMTRTGLGLAFVAAGAVVVILAVQRCLQALFLVLWEGLGRAGAELATGAAAFAIAGGLLWLGMATARR